MKRHRTSVMCNNKRPCKSFMSGKKKKSRAELRLLFGTKQNIMLKSYDWNKYN